MTTLAPLAALFPARIDKLPSLDEVMPGLLLLDVIPGLLAGVDGTVGAGSL